MACKPVMIELLLVALDEVSSEKLENPAKVYLISTNKLLLRNISTEKTFTSTTEKLYFLCELAFEMMDTEELRIHYKNIPERIKNYFGKRIKGQHELDAWDYDLRNQTLLHRNASGSYEFAHKSLAEYFMAYKLSAEIGTLDSEYKMTYCEADGQPCKPPENKNNVDISEFPLPNINLEVAKFFADMSGDKLSEILHSFNDKVPNAREFLETKEALEELLQLKPTDNTINFVLAVLKEIQKAINADSATISLLFRDEIIVYQSTNPVRKFDTMTLGIGVSGSVFQKKEKIKFGKIEKINKKDSQGFTPLSMLAIPLKYKEDLFGICSFESCNNDNFKDSDLKKAEKYVSILSGYLRLHGLFSESWNCISKDQRFFLVSSLNKVKSRN